MSLGASSGSSRAGLGRPDEGVWAYVVRTDISAALLRMRGAIESIELAERGSAAQTKGVRAYVIRTGISAALLRMRGAIESIE